MDTSSWQAVALTAPHLSRLRIGLGVVVLASLLTCAESLLRALVAGVHPEATSQGQPPDVAGAVGLVAVMAGWWVFASPAHEQQRRGLNWAVRLSALGLAILLFVGLFRASAATHAMTPSLLLLGAASWGVSGVLFYGSLVLIRRIGRAIADESIQTGAMVCMIAVPVLILIGMAGTIFIVSQVLVTAIGDMSGAGAGGRAGADPLPSWAFFIPMGFMILGVVWYVGFLARVWVRLMRLGQSPAALATAH